jgi:hypothetical protein
VSLHSKSNVPSFLSTLLTHKLRVINLLADISFTDLMHDVEVFCNEKSLTEHVDLIKRRALIVQDLAAYERIETLSDDEREAFRFEAAHL